MFQSATPTRFGSRPQTALRIDAKSSYVTGGTQSGAELSTKSGWMWMFLMRENCRANSYDSGPPVTSAGAPFARHDHAREIEEGPEVGQVAAARRLGLGRVGDENVQVGARQLDL